MSRVPAGGPSTINGVLYQMLWALTRVGTLKAIDPVVDPSIGALVSVCLILEPDDGGDQQEDRDGERVIEQLKARSNGKAWSLQEIVTEVLPDLYRAVDLSQPRTTYRFITETHIGKWQSVLTFFQSLDNIVREDVLEELDDVEEIKFGRGERKSKDPKKKPFWEGRYTQRRLFQQIAAVLRQRKEVAEEPIETTYAKLWHLLANFRFVAGQTARGLQVAVDSWLRAIIPVSEELTRCRNALILDLARRATAGGARIVATDYLAEQGYNAIPLSEWIRIIERGREELTADLEVRGFDVAEDARPDFETVVTERWTAERPILILTGESGGGQGKTWLGYSLLHRAIERQEVAILVEATGDALSDLDQAAAYFWQSIVGHDNSLPFGRIAARLKEASPGHDVRPLCLLVDRLLDPDEARRFALERWEDRGMRLAVTCSPEVAAVIRLTAPNRFVEVAVPDFSVEELHRYLVDCLGEDWPTIPGDVRAVLRRPLLARLYRDLAGLEPWQPTLEYELYERCWHDLFERQGVHVQDVVPLYRLARSLLSGANYPWTVEQTAEAGFNIDALDRLVRAGWLRSTSHGCYEVWHDRLLNWTVAEALLSGVQGDRNEAPAVYVSLKNLLGRRELVARRNLSYVPMDFVWLVVSAPAEHGLGDLLASVVAELEGAAAGRRIELLYAHLLPTVGPRILPFLFERLRTAAQRDTRYLAELIATTIVQFDSEFVLRSALTMLADENPLVQRAAMRVFAERPAAAALEQLWQRHCTRHANPDLYARPKEHHTYSYGDSFDALRACVLLNPDWLESAIDRANPSNEPVHDLAYLVANLEDGGQCWSRCKPTLMAKVLADQERCIATNILTHLDSEEIDWLRQRIHRHDNVLGPVALRALVRIAPDVALSELDRFPERELYLTRDWTLNELLVRIPEATNEHLLDRIKNHQTPWSLGQAYQGHEIRLTVPILELLLDATATLLAEDISNPTPSGQAPRALKALTMLLPIANPELLECFRRRRQLPLERNLTAWLLARGPQHGEYQQLDKDRGLQLLAKIGGPGFTTAINRYLQTGDRHGRREGLRFASRMPDTTTIGILADQILSDELWDEQAMAARVLAAGGCWLEVVTYIVHWGFWASTDVCDYRHDVGVLDDQTMTPALSVVQAGLVPTPGVILAIGFGNRRDHIDFVRDTLEQSAQDSELARASTISLGWLKDDDPRTASMLRSRLAIPNLRSEAIATLREINSDAAVEVLCDQLQAEYDRGLAIELLCDPRTASTVVPLVQHQLRTADKHSRLDLLSSLLVWAGTDRTLEEVLADKEIRDSIRETAFDNGTAVIIGSRRVAIRALARFDPAAAFVAAQASLRSDTENREGCVYVLVDIDPDQAFPFLLDHALTEKSSSVLWAIGRSLANTNHRIRICADLAASNPRCRATTCHIASRLAPSEWLVEAIRVCLDDPDIRVATAARESLEALEITNVVERLSMEVRACRDRSHRWTLLDSLVATADPGDDFQPWPTWAQSVASELPRDMRAYIADQIKRRRKEMLEAARRKD